MKTFFQKIYRFNSWHFIKVVFPIFMHSTWYFAGLKKRAEEEEKTSYKKNFCVSSFKSEDLKYNKTKAFN